MLSCFHGSIIATTLAVCNSIEPLVRHHYDGRARTTGISAVYSQKGGHLASGSKLLCTFHEPTDLDLIHCFWLCAAFIQNPHEAFTIGVF